MTAQRRRGGRGRRGGSHRRRRRAGLHPVFARRKKGGQFGLLAALAPLILPSLIKGAKKLFRKRPKRRRRR